MVRIHTIYIMPKKNRAKVRFFIEIKPALEQKIL